MWLNRSVFIVFLLSVILARADVVQALELDAKNGADKLSSITLESIMADPDWLGNSPETPSWSLDNQSIYFQQKATGHSHFNSVRINLESMKTTVLEKEQLLVNASARAKLNPSGSLGVFSYQGNLFIIDVKSNEITSITADEREQISATFVSDKVFSYRVGFKIYLYDLDLHLERLIADFKTVNDPDDTGKQNYLRRSQPRLLNYIKKEQQESKFQIKRHKALAEHSFKTWYMGKDNEIKTFRLSPDAKWLLLGMIESSRIGKSDHMSKFVTQEGYVEDRKVRPLVGTSKAPVETFYLVDLLTEEKHKLDMSKLPGINDDPLSALRKKAAKKFDYVYEDKKGPRAIYAYDFFPEGNQGVEWSRDSSKVAMVLFAYDNKARWIVTVNTDKKKVNTAHWLSDDAWVNDWSFNEFGWLPDNQTLYYLSEESGYSHIYIKKGKRRASQVTEGNFEIDHITVSEKGNRLFYRANKKHPGIYEVYVLDIDKRDSRMLTDLNGMNDYVLSRDEKKMIITHSSMNEKPELYLQSVKKIKKSKKITDTMSQAYKDIPWREPKVIAIQSSQVDRPIYSRLYQPLASPNPTKRPAVMFVHGSGYSQNAHQGWSTYFREHMFHQYLTRKGFVVLDMDYRASKGYGRDWRTAIYRNMGTPELQDLIDGAQWLVDNMNVDGSKIGVYGGSYGGFMTFMALFKEPELFAAGAALRPVTDWSHYNHAYTSNILNTPQVDPEAYERSSPIEFAEGLSKPLLICHGMVDDNVFFKDSVRLVQRLIELKKTQFFETAIYPVERHGFTQPSSWLDEYTRIDQLFERFLR